MNKLFIVIFLFLQAVFCTASDRIDEFQARLAVERIDFSSSDLHDISCVKNILSAMCELDQDVRQFFIQDRNNPETRLLLTEMDYFHTQTTKDILAIHHWINISTFGLQADNQAWLLVQHADHDPQFQTKCLLRLENLYQQNETHPKNYAYLYDRVAVASKSFGMKQKYGTQCSISDSGEVSLHPYDGTIKDINARRNQVGLSSIEDYLEQIQKMHQK